MTLCIHALFLLVGGQAPNELDLLQEGVSAWGTPSRVKRCPAHSAITPSKASDGPGVEFTGERNGKFSLVEREVSDSSLGNFAGLRLRFDGAPPAWTMRLGHSSSSSHRYVAVLEGTNDQSMFVPFRAFQGQTLHRGGIDSTGTHLSGDKVKTIGALLPGIVGISSGNFILRELVATPLPAGVDPSITIPVYLNSAGEVSSTEDTANQCSCDFGCGRCAILAHLRSGICTSSQYGDLCRVSASGLLRRLAAGFSTPDCTSEKQEHVRQWLQTGQYLGKCLPSHADAVGAGINDLMQGLLRTHFSPDSIPDAPCDAGTAAGTSGFVGPFVAMGISGHNDLGVTKGVTVEQCLELCRANSKCRSIDYGARDTVIGECWLSTANRDSAGHDFTEWALYDYYEVSDDDSAVVSAAGAPVVRNASMQVLASIPADKQTALLESAGLLKTDCCKQPSSCIKGAISAGVSKYNSGDVVSCFFLYHAAASRIGQCGESGAPGYPFFLQAAAITGASDKSLNSAAWQLRRSLDIVLAIKDDVCGSSFPAEDTDAAPSPSNIGAASSPSSELVGEFAENFVGPFEGMGISGWNDIQEFRGKSAEECLAECLKQSRCKSVDFGARGSVVGECWLSTADRNSVGSSYREWPLYDYYERVSSGTPGARADLPLATATNAGDSQSTETTQEDSLSDPVASLCKRNTQVGVAVLLFMMILS